MTRASQGSAPVFRVMYAKKSGMGGNYPQWMRTLEEKYQKLHRKITENTATGNTRYGHSLGKSVYDSRLSHVLLKYRDIGSAKQNARQNFSTKKGGNVQTDCDINKENTEQTLICRSNTPGQYLENEEIDKQTQPSNNDLHVTDDCLKSNSIKTPPKETTGDLNEFKERSLEGDQERIEINQTSDNSLKHIDDKQIENEIESLEFAANAEAVNNSKGVISDNNKPSRRHIKTSISRTSKLTSRSCPAKIQSKSAAKLKFTETTLLSRNITAQKNSKMFTPMSEEAKHAITETIQEMNISVDNRRRWKQGDVQFIPSRTRKCVKNWSAPKPVKPIVVYNTNAVLNSVSKTLNDINDDGPKCGASNNGDEFSFRSSSGSCNKDRLPNIQNEGVSDSNLVRNQSYRLPGIGKFEISQADSQFEITPPGFDVRYNDIQPVENRDSETPPPDIRQMAIEKCSEWLNKYSK